MVQFGGDFLNWGYLAMSKSSPMTTAELWVVPAVLPFVICACLSVPTCFAVRKSYVCRKCRRLFQHPVCADAPLLSRPRVAATLSVLSVIILFAVVCVGLHTYPWSSRAHACVCVCITPG
jgi:hypothetical protein